ncbi:MAG TPA: hypothetical protein VF916_05405 [Ktedonobacterales bacterium]|nr:hypothetical protein [Steroidobacteraceae bacterium]
MPRRRTALVMIGGLLQFRESAAINGILKSPTQRFRALFGGGRKHAEELRFASRICAESLTALAEVRAARPQLSGDELYAAVIARRLASDERKARAILDRTYASLEDWGNDREPKLLDVVTYMIVSEYLAATPGEKGMSIDLRAYLKQHIDPSV